MDSKDEEETSLNLYGIIMMLVSLACLIALSMKLASETAIWMVTHGPF